MSTLSELYALDPLLYSKDGDDLRKIIAHLREGRANYIAGNQRAGKAPKLKGEIPEGFDLGEVGL